MRSRGASPKAKSDALNRKRAKLEDDLNAAEAALLKQMRKYARLHRRWKKADMRACYHYVEREEA